MSIEDVLDLFNGVDCKGKGRSITLACCDVEDLLIIAVDTSLFW